MLGKLIRRPRFILVDPSFDGKNGDKWQYAMAFCDSARRNKFDFILLAHKDAPYIEREAGGEVDQRNVFSAGFYHHGQIVDRHTLGADQRRLRSLDLQANKRLKALDEKIERLERDGDFVAAERARLERAEILRKHIESSADLLEAIKRTESATMPFNRDDFAHELHKQLEELQPRSGDILFLHTATQAIMESLTEISALKEREETYDIDAYFLFHFGAEAPDSRTFIDRFYSYSHFNSLAARLKSGSPFRRTHLLATHPLLRQELEGFFGLPVGIFDGLTNLDRYVAALGGAKACEETRAKAVRALSGDQPSLGVRAADLDSEGIAALQTTVRVLRRMGVEPRVRIAYHAANHAKAIEMIAGVDEDVRAAFAIEDTHEHTRYIAFLAESSLVILPYKPEIYKKRVSAVLHDCAVLGVPCVVPRHSTLQDSREYADVYVFEGLGTLPGVVFRAYRALRNAADRAVSRKARAEQLFASDVVGRLRASTPQPSLTTFKRGPIATVFMPLWGRVGSSYAIEAQIRYLLDAGYFVIQILALDKAADHTEARPFYWRMLFENSRAIRGSIMRIAYRDADPDFSATPEKMSGFDVYLDGICSNALWDANIESLAKKSIVTVVNHVFNSRLAKRLGGGHFILETHDIQSRQMVRWPLRDPITGEPENYRNLIEKEIAEIALYDYVVNVSNAEHSVLRRANTRSRVVTPYITLNKTASQFESVSAMSHAYNWDKSYHEISKFDILLMGDSHPANVESAVWFFEEVFVPFLAPKHVTVGLVGRLADHVYQKLPKLGFVYYCGFVDDIADVRYLSRLTVLPDRRGTGISIKTLESLAYSAPFVGTSVAFRGLADCVPDGLLEFYDEPDAFAERVLELLEDEAALVAASQKAGELYSIVSGRAKFDTAWREIFNSLRLPAGSV